MFDSKLLLAAVLVVLLLMVGQSAIAVDDVAFIIDKKYASCMDKVLQYKADVEARFDVRLHICNSASFESFTPEQMRNYIKILHNNNGVDGVILAGQIQYALWEQTWPWYNSGINSNFYEDLDCTFTDTDGNGMYDYHDWGTNIGPEVWCSWMRPPASTSEASLASFLDKTHAYYTGQVQFNHSALIADHQDYDDCIHNSFDQYGNLSKLYGNNIDVLGEGDAYLDREDYLNLLQQNRYEICDPMSHAWCEGQQFDVGGVTSNDIDRMTGGAIMTFIYGCHSAAFNESPNYNIAQMYCFGNSIGQVSAGTSWSYGMGEKYAIYDVLANGGYVGQGWFALQKLVNSPEYLHLSYQDQVDIYRQMWGHNLIGNPFIYANYTPAVPEPSSLFALLVPCAGVLFAYRRRK
ncbi:MAG TPA: hypothetical protein PLU88_11105 [Armatimonadota bacterium]|nr:hypothetical protein [Armatimonadota bacterium]